MNHSFLKYYYMIVGVIVNFVITYGFLVPWLISMKNTFAVICGVALAILTLPCPYFAFKGHLFSKDKK